MSRCVFCDIVGGRSPDTNIEYENDKIVIFRDIKPAAENHFLAVSKIHYESAKTLRKEHIDLIDLMEKSLTDHLTNMGVDTKDSLYGFHWPPMISVKHLHMHAIAPASKMSLTYRLMFKADSFWFRTPESVRQTLRES
ncbi:adenosine 5'-monophosphoramidase HINT3-like [Eupeodes corollae]|uniref:adenosine 5'-monophosphoramidase HINT3-like n=1 Tax=Eupeodes corollae TaxID=290404 RepID=UPI0024914707|nr:adenosine 5'-monophosphoramidase HINT3-like [Eupeodes corollae]